MPDPWPRGPSPDSYWVEPGRLAAGGYPIAAGIAEGRAKLEAIRDAGVDFFLDLTEPDEYRLRPYDADLAPEVEYRRLPVEDLSAPSMETMREVLDSIDDALARGKTVYVHCYGGIGRTGTVVGCYLVRRGADPAAALAQIAEWRRETPDGRRSSPETPEQVALMEAWAALDRGRQAP